MTQSEDVAISQQVMQEVGGVFPLTLNQPQVVFPGIARTIQLASAQDLSGMNFTITGTDIWGNITNESIAGPNNNSVTSINLYHTITSIVADAAITGNLISVNTGDSGVTQWISFDNNRTIFQASAQITVTGTIDYSVQYTNQPLQLRNYPLNNTIYNETPSASSTLIYLDNENYKVIQNETSSVFYQLNIPVQAMQVVVNSGLTTGTLSVNVIQQGI